MRKTIWSRIRRRVKTRTRRRIEKVKRVEVRGGRGTGVERNGIRVGVRGGE